MLLVRPVHLAIAGPNPPWPRYPSLLRTSVVHPARIPFVAVNAPTNAPPCTRILENHKALSIPMPFWLSYDHHDTSLIVSSMD